MVVVLNPLFLSCCKIGKIEAGKFERARSLNALASVNRIPCEKKPKKMDSEPDLIAMPWALLWRPSSSCMSKRWTDFSWVEAVLRLSPPPWRVLSKWLGTDPAFALKLGGPLWSWLCQDCLLQEQVRSQTRCFFTTNGVFQTE